MLSSGLPHLIQNTGYKYRLVLRQKRAVMLLDHVRCIFDRVARLFIRTGLLQNVGGKDIADIMRPVGQ